MYSNNILNFQESTTIFFFNLETYWMAHVSLQMVLLILGNNLDKLSAYNIFFDGGNSILKE